jgi:NAD(P)-dependent dehydrogenase (short-subunit alcohol dehydrogenase family)
MPVDVTAPSDDLAQYAKEVDETLGGVDYLVLAAGLSTTFVALGAVTSGRPRPSYFKCFKLKMCDCALVSALLTVPKQ